MSTALWFYAGWVAFTSVVGFAVVFLGLMRPLVGPLVRPVWGLRSAAVAASAFDPPRPPPPRVPLWRRVVLLPWGVVFLVAIGPVLAGVFAAFSVASSVLYYRRLRRSCARLLRCRRVRWSRLWSYFVTPRLFLVRAFTFGVRFFHLSPLPNHALQRTGTGGGASSDLHA